MEFPGWLAVCIDFAILGWLVFCWFYEGHHRRCKVDVLCPKCKGMHEENCTAGNGEGCV